MLNIEDYGEFELGLQTFNDAGFATALSDPIDEEDYVFIEIDSTSMVDLRRMLYLEDWLLANYDPDRNTVCLRENLAIKGS